MIKNSLNQADLFRLGDFLRQHCKIIGDGAAQYEPGWSDQRVVDESPVKATIYNVTGLRRALLGELKVVKPVTLEEHVAKLEERVMTLMEMDELIHQRLSLLEVWGAKRPVQPFVATLCHASTKGDVSHG